MFTGISTQRMWWYELALFTAWHVAAFTSATKVGKLQPWTHYQQKVSGKTSAAPSADWKTRKAERKQQMADLQKHREIRQRPVRKRG